MPVFFDHHTRMPPMSPETMEQARKMLDQMREDIRAKTKDKFGVTPINVYTGINGDSWCLNEAPTADAIIKSHEARGVKLTIKDITQITLFV